ncbi:C-X3-C motif chemokine ligand 1 [Phyllostomus discolor]|uniref:C-X3-C motif chemokine ligand 1 n=1 Tax=Phyllostomus discolor TaxID=89673 RepID=A0A834DBU9_9CHIR|nr:C-X3-C motif chemokine ligand 1 [Phyllostomus discolor]
MASPLSWLLRLAALYCLIVLLAGQHHGVSKCTITCKTVITQKIPENRLIGYQRNQASCGKPAIILETIKHRLFCANPEDEWVRKAMENLDRKAAAAVGSDGGVFEKRTGDEPTTSLAAGGGDGSAGSEPGATGESSVHQETQTALGTPPELPPRLAGSWGTRSPSTSKAPDGGPSAGPERTELFSASAVTGPWRSSSAYRPGSDLWTKGEASEAPSTQAPSTQTPSTQALPTEAPSTQTPFTQAPSTQAPSTQSPALSHGAPEDHTGSEGPSVRISAQDPTSQGSLGPTDASRVPHVSSGLTPSTGASPTKPETSSNGALMAKVSSHDPQAATRRQAVGLLAFLGLLFGLGVAMFAYQSLQGCPRNVAGDMVEGLRHVPRSCGSNSYVLVPV